jgi:hypothetical protein
VHPKWRPGDDVAALQVGPDLGQLGEGDSEIAAIAKYFHNAGLFGIGQGRLRVWPDKRAS